ncbi:MAG: redox-regulated ATPase YchF [Proteobacteria bacterium]|nr:MAG: redox-regulated ATPase YchF [Pseudomonadota bacterium]
MSLNVGVVGLPNVGKSTIFNALTRAGARVENFPFCTVDPNHGVVPVPDGRLEALAQLLEPPKLTPATLDIVDIAGLVRGAHKGEGLGNQFLGHIRAVDAVLHVVRCFGGDTVHVDGDVDPVRDLEIVELELTLADLETVERRLVKLDKEAKGGVKEAKAQWPVVRRFAEALRADTQLRRLDLDEYEVAVARELGLITAKPVLYVANVDDSQLGDDDDPMVGALRAHLEATGDRWIALAAQLEAEISQLDDPEDRALFLADMGLEEPGLDRLARAAYGLLGLITFYTFAGGKELRAWALRDGTHAPRAAGKIHSDMERGFIRAEVCPAATFLKLGSEAAVRSKGLLRSEGKDYALADGDVVHFKFAV